MKGHACRKIGKKHRFEKGGVKMGQSRQFRAGEKAPNNGEYIEIGETGSMVKNPQKLRLKAGDRFPENSNHNRLWSYMRKP
jgi:YjzC-like protein